MSEVSRASASLEQEVSRSGRTVRQTTTYNPTTGKTAKIIAVQNQYACLAEVDNKELRTNIKIENFYLEIESVGANMGGGFTNTNELKIKKYQEVLMGQTKKSGKKKLLVSTIEC